MTYFIHSLIAIAAFLIGFQIELRELRLLTGRYNYRIQAAQSVTFLATLLAIGGMIWNCFGNIPHTILFSAGVFLLVAVSEWILTRMNPSRALFSWGFRIAGIILLSSLITRFSSEIQVVPFLLAGLYLRNSPFAIPHGKKMGLAYAFQRKLVIKKDFPQDEQPLDPENCFAGNQHFQASELPLYQVTDYGLKPDSPEDQLELLQQMIDQIGEQGGGRVFFPRGKYYFNKGKGRFIQINHSHITLEGETDQQGKPQAILINCGPTSEGHKAPWLSPFFITTGEQIQPSNEFFGLQFRKRKKVFSQSNSLSDPGSDGEILTPQFITRITQPACKGDVLLHVESTVGVERYVMLGLYNTTSDGNLIKEILGTSSLRPEWTTALRAGEEEAPSYQWLVEVEAILDEHTLRLTRPLLRDCQMEYEPELFNVEMLEDVSIRNLQLESMWNGTFRHHGFPIYYSIAQSQEMDYGWNAINMKRVAHGEISNLIISNFSNPIYVLDSRNITTRDLVIRGYDGHQGIKIYQHACDCLFTHITFLCHFADMMGGEGNAYGNIFSHIRYLNPVFKPVDYDFHGFTEGPMSPPADNLFHDVTGFRYIKSAGAIYNLPSCAQNNAWHHIITEGEKRGDILFYAMTYRQKKGLLRFITAVGFTVAMVQKNHRINPAHLLKTYREKLKSIDETGVPERLHYQFFPNSYIDGIITTSDLSNLDHETIHLKNCISV